MAAVAVACHASATASFAGRRVASGVSNGSKVQARATWLPGAKVPDYLDGSLPGDYGCDPFGLAEDPANFTRFREAEVLHARWAMLGVAGMVAVELEPNAPGGWLDAALWFKNGEPGSYVGNPLPVSLGAVVAIQFLSMSISELKRASIEDIEERIYPGGSFDPLGLSTSWDVEDMKRKEIANGRVAMLASAGCFFQASANPGTTPLGNLTAHIADPGHANIVASGATPFLLYGIK